MKTKAYIKQGSYQRSSKKINGALDVNKEVLDTLVDKEVIGTVNCCQYFPLVSVMSIEEFNNLTANLGIPPNTFVSVVDENGYLQGLYFVYSTSEGGLTTQLMFNL